MILNYISFPIFIISFIVGLIFIYILGPDMKKIYIYPSPENVNKVLFQDKAENCFLFEPEIIKCPDDKTLLSTIPIQI